MKEILKKLLKAINEKTENGTKPLMLLSEIVETGIEGGLCTLASEVLGEEEDKEFTEYLYGEFPDRYRFEFIWNAGEAKPRIAWLEAQIKKLETV